MSRAPWPGRLAVGLWVAAVAALGAAAPAPAQTAPAASRFGPGSPALSVAQEIARRTWGADPCDGAVSVVWGPDDPAVNARSTWTNPTAVYGYAEANADCRIVFNEALDPSWGKFCTILVHEYGHLAGWQHSVDGPDVMSPLYRAPIPDCVATPDPSAPAAAVSRPTPTQRPRPRRRAGARRSDRRSCCDARAAPPRRRPQPSRDRRRFVPSPG